MRITALEAQLIVDYSYNDPELTCAGRREAERLLDELNNTAQVAIPIRPTNPALRWEDRNHHGQSE